LSTLYILKSLMTQLNHERQKSGAAKLKPCELFDLIGGTSTGGDVQDASLSTRAIMLTLPATA
jgi:patatin-like phospholipase/acyl hydrolase